MVLSFNFSVYLKSLTVSIYYFYSENITSIFRSWFKAIGNVFTRIKLPKGKTFSCVTELETNLVLKSGTPLPSIVPILLGVKLDQRDRIFPLESWPSLNKVVVPLFALMGRKCSLLSDTSSPAFGLAGYSNYQTMMLVHFSLYHHLWPSTLYTLLTSILWTPGLLHEC